MLLKEQFTQIKIVINMSLKITIYFPFIGEMFFTFYAFF